MLPMRCPDVHVQNKAIAAIFWRGRFGAGAGNWSFLLIDGGDGGERETRELRGQGSGPVREGVAAEGKGPGSQIR